MSPRTPENKAGASGDVGLQGIVGAQESLATVFAAFADPTRLAFVAMLRAGGVFSIAQLTANTHISRQGVTKHLRVPADAGLVHGVKRGREWLWQLDPAQLDEARRTL